MAKNVHGLVVVRVARDICTVAPADEASLDELIDSASDWHPSALKYRRCAGERIDGRLIRWSDLFT